MPSQRTGFLTWICTLFNSFCICVLTAVCARVSVPALIYKVLVYAGLNDLLTKPVWIRSSLLAFSRVLYPDSICQFGLMIAPSWGLPFRFCLLKLFGNIPSKGPSLTGRVHTCKYAPWSACLHACSSFLQLKLGGAWRRVTPR